MHCNSISCYNASVVREHVAYALVHCNSISCYNGFLRSTVLVPALVHCNSISCYNQKATGALMPTALVHCNSISCYNPHPRKSPSNRGFDVIEFWKTRKSGHFSARFTCFLKKGAHLRHNLWMCRRIYSTSDLRFRKSSYPSVTRCNSISCYE